MSSEKRKFKYKLSGFEQMWDEIERLEGREIILVKALKLMMADDLTRSRDEIYQDVLTALQSIPGKSAGYKMIENMGIEFYEITKETLKIRK